MIVNKYKGNGGGGSGERGPQGYQGPEGPQGPQGPAGSGGDSHILKASSGTPENIGVGDVYAVTSNTRTLKPREVVSSVTVTYTGREITFKFYAGDEYKSESGGIDAAGNPWGAWGMEGDVILGPWGSTYGIQMTSSGNEHTFTTLNPGNYESSQMYGFNIDIVVSGSSYELYQAIDDGQGGATEKEKMAKVSDLPADSRLVPEGGDFDYYLRKGGEGPEWSSIRQVPFTDMQKDYTGAVLMSTSAYADEYGWGFIDVLNPVSSVPKTAKDGAVWAYAQKGQSGGWKSYDGGSYNKMRVNNTTGLSLYFYYGTENVNIEFAGTGMTVNGNLWLPVAGKFSGTTAGGLGITGQTADGYFYCETDSDVSNISMQPSFFTLEVGGKEIPESYGIKQYQGLSATETEWISKDDIPKDREYGIYDFRVDITDPNTYAQIDFDIKGCTNNLTWGDGAWKSSLISLIDDGNGVYTGSSVCGWNVSAWTSGSYFYVSCDYSMEDGINIYNDGDWEVEVPKPVAANVVTSVDIKRMVKISQADYTALAVKDPETMYIIIG